MSARIRIESVVETDFELHERVHCPLCGTRGVWLETNGNGLSYRWGCVECKGSWSMNTLLDSPLDMHAVALKVNE